MSSFILSHNTRIALIAILALIFFLRMREKKEKFLEAIIVDNMNDKPSPREGAPIIY